MTSEIPEVQRKIHGKHCNHDKTDEIPLGKHTNQEDQEEEFKTDFLISPGDIYPNKKVRRRRYIIRHKE